MSLEMSADNEADGEYGEYDNSPLDDNWYSLNFNKQHYDYDIEFNIAQLWMNVDFG